MSAVVDNRNISNVVDVDIPVVDAQDIDTWLLTAQGCEIPKLKPSSQDEGKQTPGGAPRRIVQVENRIYGVQEDVLDTRMHVSTLGVTPSTRVDLPPGLQGISPSEFESYLKAVHHADSPDVTLTSEDWLSAHHIAHLSADTALRLRCVSEIATAVAPHGNLLAQIERYGLRDACATEVLKLIIRRGEPLSAVETTCISGTFASQVGEAQKSWEMKSKLHRKAPNMKRIMEQVWGGVLTSS